ncbi:MAG: metallopeptidase family protein [Patescibacteria group bacterium]
MAGRQNDSQRNLRAGEDGEFCGRMKTADAVALVEKLVERELARLRRKNFPEVDAAVVRVEIADPEDAEKYGEFLGVPLAEFSIHDSGELPNEIVIFAAPLVRDFGTGVELEKEVRITILHEFGHLLGMSEAEVEARGLE